MKLSIKEQFKLINQLFEEYLTNSSSKARLNLSLNKMMSQIDDLEDVIEPELREIISGSMIDFYDNRFSLLGQLMGNKRISIKAKKTFEQRLSLYQQEAIL